MTTLDIFSKSFLREAADQMVVGTASAVAGPLAAAGLALTAAGPEDHVSIPWWIVLMSAAVGALTGLSHAVIGAKIPGTDGTKVFIRAPKAARSAARPRRRRATRKTKATTTADLKKPPATQPPSHSG
jgi:hypothetical protein